MDKKIFAFDVGTASLGECVRQGSEIKHLESLLMPEDWGSIELARNRRRQLRTRLAHRARENWWKEQAKLAGLEVLETRQPTKENPNVKPDPKMLREFSSEGDNTLYASCLLRIALLRGHKLESWQIFKAIWSAIQHRGYDKDLPWKSKKERTHFSVTSKFIFVLRNFLSHRDSLQ